MSKPGQSANITNIELDHVVFKNEEPDRIYKNKERIHPKRFTKTHTSFGSRAESIKGNQRINLMLKDYEYLSSSKKRGSVDTRKMISIYENDRTNLKDITNYLK